MTLICIVVTVHLNFSYHLANPLCEIWSAGSKKEPVYIKGLPPFLSFLFLRIVDSYGSYDYTDNA